LNLHGYLYGYSDTTISGRGNRGHRIYCSNRNNRCGCGRTFSVLFSHFIRNLSVQSFNLWMFLQHILNGLTLINSMNLLDTTLSNQCWYDLYHRFKMKQSFIRTRLMSVKDPPLLPKVTNVIHQTIFHLKASFYFSSDPISSYQNHFQRSFI
jgi:hypothetical protein